MKKMGYLFVSLLLLLVSSVFVAADNNSNKIADLDARYAHFVCGVTLQQAQSALLGTYVQAPSTDKLTTDLAQVKQAADAGDRDAFALATKTLQDDVKSINTDMKGARQSFRTLNISRVDKRKEFADLATNWKANTEIFKTCVLSAQKNVATVKAGQVQADIDRWNEVIANMTAKGFDTTQLQAIVSDAEKLISSLNDASQATDETTFKQKMDDERDLQLHVWARFAITRINLYLDKMTDKANAAGMSNKLDEINSLLNKASVMAASGHKYADGEFDQTWQDIKDAATKLSDLGKALKQAKTSSNQTGGAQ